LIEHEERCPLVMGAFLIEGEGILAIAVGVEEGGGFAFGPCDHSYFRHHDGPAEAGENDENGADDDPRPRGLLEGVTESVLGEMRYERGGESGKHGVG
jgi:hypothetical protein